MRKMIDRTEARFGLKPDWVAADTAYGSSDNLVWLTLKRHILPFIPVFDISKRKDGTWSRSDFTWDEINDRYICPEGKELRHTRRNYSDPARRVVKAGRRQYRSLKLECKACPSKTKCCPNTATRRISHEKYEIVRDFVRQCTASEFNQMAQKRRKKVEMLFSHLKRILGLGLLRIRGRCGIQDELTFAATAQKPPETGQTQADKIRHKLTKRANLGRPSQISVGVRCKAPKQLFFMKSAHFATRADATFCGCNNYAGKETALWSREALQEMGIRPCIPGRKQSKTPVRHDKRRCKRRKHIEIMFGRLKDWRRIATRYDRCPKFLLSVIALAATVLLWL